MVIRIRRKMVIPEADIKKLLIDGAEVTASAAELNAAGSGVGTLASLVIKTAKVVLGGANPTQVKFKGTAVAATKLGSQSEPFELDNGQTLTVNTDGKGDDTCTLAAAAGYLTGGNSASTDMTASIDTKFKILVDSDSGGFKTVTCDWAGCDSGADIATEMQAKIQALGGVYEAVTVAFAGGDHYVITSGTKGTNSSVEMDNADDHDCLDELDLGSGATATTGTGDAANIAAATAAEIAAALSADLGDLTAVAESGKVRLTSKTTGAGSSLVVNADSTADLILGITGSDYGEECLGFAEDMADTDYMVMATFEKASAPAGTSEIAIGDKATTGFNIYCETAGNTETVQLLIVGLNGS
ncbi:MAG: DUF3383 domain-containing protein [Phycisphaerales bacterium]|nr:DUF3383 domain-containing protein [Phycisphaerales bacterium]